MNFSSWIPDYIYQIEDDDYEIIDNSISGYQLIENELTASMTANAAIFKMMRGG